MQLQLHAEIDPSFLRLSHRLYHILISPSEQRVFGGGETMQATNCAVNVIYSQPGESLR